MSGEPLAVVVVPAVVGANAAEAGQCDAGCGLDWSLPANQEEARAQAWSKFGRRVSLSFCPPAELGACGLPDIPGRITSQALDLPLLLIDGDLRIAGNFDMRMMLGLIETELEMEID